MVARGVAVIVDTGTSTTTGYRILVPPGGDATYQAPTGSGQSQLPSSIATGFFADLAAAQPLDALASGSCSPSSDRASIYVSLDGQQTPDLSCPSGGEAQTIAEDVQKIVEQLGVTVGPSTPGQPNVPVMTY